MLVYTRSSTASNKTSQAGYTARLEQYLGKVTKIALHQISVPYTFYQIESLVLNWDENGTPLTLTISGNYDGTTLAARVESEMRAVSTIPFGSRWVVALDTDTSIITISNTWGNPTTLEFSSSSLAPILGFPQVDVTAGASLSATATYVVNPLVHKSIYLRSNKLGGTTKTHTCLWSQENNSERARSSDIIFEIPLGSYTTFGQIEYESKFPVWYYIRNENINYIDFYLTYIDGRRIRFQEEDPDWSVNLRMVVAEEVQDHRIISKYFKTEK